MTKEETIKALHEALDSVGIDFPHRFALVEAIEHLSVPESKSLDEAAEISDLEAKNLADDYTTFLAAGLIKNEPRPIAPKWMKKLASDRFKAGAEWMAEQGVKLHGRILPGTCGNLYIESDWFDRGFGGLNYKFSDSNDVDMFVQIRKK